MTEPLEGWDEEQRGQVQHDIFNTALSRHLPPLGTVLVAAVPSFDEPPTEDDLVGVITSPTNPTGSWDGPAWDEPKRYTGSVPRRTADTACS